MGLRRGEKINILFSKVQIKLYEKKIIGGKKMKRLSFCVTVLGLLVSLMLPVNAVDHEATLKSLRAEIAANNYSYTVKYSPVCDIPIDELCTLKPEWVTGSNIMLEDNNAAKPGPGNLTGVQDNDVSPALLPGVYTGYCGPVGNQGSCGSAWAFASIAAIESAFADTCGWSLDLSVNWMIDCNTAGYGCYGGWFYFPDPYDCTIPLESGYNGDCDDLSGPLYEISGAAYVFGYPYPNISNIKSAIWNYGGVAAAVYVNSAFQYYSSGCFNSCQNRTCNHAIFLCGWDDSKCSSKGAWKLKNSWGTGWGENGFMWIKYGCSRVGYAACYAAVVCADNPCN
jgi:hypothetical protein